MAAARGPRGDRNSAIVMKPVCGGREAATGAVPCKQVRVAGKHLVPALTRQHASDDAHQPSCSANAPAATVLTSSGSRLSTRCVRPLSLSEK